MKLLLGLVAVTGITSLILLWDANRQLSLPLNFAADTLIEVHPGQNLLGLSHQLQQKGLMSQRQALYWVAYGRFTGEATRLKAGEYETAATLTPKSLLTLLTSGKVKQHSFTIVEGWTVRELLSQLALVSELKHELPTDPQAVMAALGEPGHAPEGVFFPDTYRFPRGFSDRDFLLRARRVMQETLQSEWEARAPLLPLTTPYEALVLASIIERETGKADERAEIAGVFVRRLQRGMLLQTDPTVIYGLGERFDGNLRRIDLTTDSPYNTYMRAGLPPTPIAIPGREAIHAALHPAAGEALYFVARGDGSHEFTATLKEHEAAVRKYQLRKETP